LGSQNVLEVNEPVLIVRSDDDPLGPKHVALSVILMIIIDVLDGNMNTLNVVSLMTDLADFFGLRTVSQMLLDLRLR